MIKIPINYVFSYDKIIDKLGFFSMNSNTSYFFYDKIIDKLHFFFYKTVILYAFFYDKNTDKLGLILYKYKYFIFFL